MVDLKQQSVFIFISLTAYILLIVDSSPYLQPVYQVGYVCVLLLVPIFVLLSIDRTVAFIICVSGTSIGIIYMASDLLYGKLIGSLLVLPCLVYYAIDAYKDHKYNQGS